MLLESGIVPVSASLRLGACGTGDAAACTAKYTITQADLDAGHVTNAARTTGFTPNDDAVFGGPADATVTARQRPAIHLVKSASREELVDAVRRVAAGDTVFTPGLAGLVLGEFRRMAEGPEPEPDNELTPRETEILKMVATGLSYRQIAERLVLSHRTVQNHVQNTLRKLQMHNRVELTRYALERGLDDE